MKEWIRQLEIPPTFNSTPKTNDYCFFFWVFIVDSNWTFRLTKQSKVLRLPNQIRLINWCCLERLFSITLCFCPQLFVFVVINKLINSSAHSISVFQNTKTMRLRSSRRFEEREGSLCRFLFAYPNIIYHYINRV